MPPADVLEDASMDEEHRAKDERAFLSAIVESSQDAIIGKSLDGTILSWNSGAEAIYGWSAQEAVGRSISIIVPEDRGDEPRMIIERIQRGERIEAFETLRVRRDGRLVHISLTVSPVHGANGEIVAAATVERDVTARKRTEEALRESEQRLKDVVASSSDWLWETDDQGRFVYVV